MESTPRIKPRKIRTSKVSGTTGGQRSLERHETTTLDRLHAAMLLQKTGQTNALRVLLQTELEHGPDFLRLANALSALYPRESEEKRLVDAMIQAMPR